MDQPPAVAITAFADAWLRAIETEIGAALCAIKRGKGFQLFFDIVVQTVMCRDTFCWGGAF